MRVLVFNKKTEVEYNANLKSTYKSKFFFKLLYIKLYSQKMEYYT